MNRILDSWGSHLNEWALLLLQKAEEVAETQGIDVNILHIVFIALTNTTLDANKVITKAIKDEKKLAGLIDEIQNMMVNDALYLSLDMYRIACIVAAQRNHIQISDALILAQVLEKSYTIERLLLSHDIALYELKRAFQEQANATKALTDAPSFFLPSRASVLEEADIVELRREVKDIFITQEKLASSVLTKIDDALHSNTFDTLLRGLEKILRENDDALIIFCGQNGSVLDVLEDVLAYRLGLVHLPEGAHSPSTPSEMLSGYRLWKISLNTLRDLYSRNHRFHPAVALKYVKQEAVKEKAILLLTGLETLSRRSPVDRKIKEQLSHPSGACIMGCYTYYERQPEENEVKLSLDNATIITPEKLNDEMTFRDLTKQYHYARWEEKGYTLDDTTFDSLFILEPGIWIYKQRKTFPYLAIDLADDCAYTLQFGEQHVRNMASDALVALECLLTKEAPQAREEDRERFLKTLEGARERVKGLYAHPTPQRREERTVITQALIEAQLFCRNNSEFHFPGFFPWPVPIKR
jgi:hypothetical protein